MPRLISSSDSLTQALQASAKSLIETLSTLTFSREVVAMTYCATDYTWEVHAAYLEKIATSWKEGGTLLLGINPGPWGMAQTGVPFGEIAAVRDWMKLSGRIGKPRFEHPKRPILGWDCPRSEVSGRRLWGLFSQQYLRAEDCFTRYAVMNFCPLVWMGERGNNLTPDKIPTAQRMPVEDACQRHLAEVIHLLNPHSLIGVGAYAKKKIEQVVKDSFDKVPFLIGQILHPSPASPAANRGWEQQAIKQLEALGLWE